MRHASLLISSLVLSTFLHVSPARAWFGKKVAVPAVQSQVVDSETGSPIAGARIEVLLIGSEKSGLDLLKEAGEDDPDAAQGAGIVDRLDDLDDPDSPFKVVARLSAETDADGSFSLPATKAKLGKLHLMGAAVVVGKEGYAARKDFVVNIRILGGSLGAFIIGAIDVQGDDFNKGFWTSIKAGRKQMKNSKFPRVYGKFFDEKTMKLSRPGDEDRSDNFDQLYAGE